MENSGIASSQQDHDADAEVRPRAVLDDAAPAVPEALLASASRRGGGSSVRSLAPLNDEAGDDEQRSTTTRPSEHAPAGAEGDADEDRRRRSGPPRSSAARVVLSMRAPTQPSRAGSRVSEAITIEQHADRRRDGDAGDEREAHQRQAEQGDDHGRAGEDHGPAAGVEGLGDRVVDARARRGAPRGSG